jgi:hypothetical protein
VSLSQDPTFEVLRDQMVCGTKDIENKRYAGASGKHEPDGNAIDTTNGAGPHNIQMFILSSDGTVLTCLPGYWNSKDLVEEIKLASRLNDVWKDPSLTRAQKDQLFRQMQLDHVRQHPAAEVKRSRMQGFDQMYEAKKRLYSSDCIVNARLIDPTTGKGPQQAFKTTDVIMHQRMAQRPFVPYNDFDVAAFADYGKPMYDKEEDYRDANGQVIPGAAREEPKIGNDPRAHPVKTETEKIAKTGLRQGLRTFLRFGVQAALR